MNVNISKQSIIGVCATLAFMVMLTTSILFTPAPTSAASRTCGTSCTYENLKDLLPKLFLEELTNVKKILETGGVADSIGIQAALDEVQKAISSMPATADTQWVAAGNKAVETAEQALQKYRTLEANGTINRQTQIKNDNDILSDPTKSADEKAAAEARLKYNTQRQEQIVNKANAGTDPPPSCSSMFGFFSNLFACVARTVSNVVATLFVSAAAWLLSLSGFLFEWLVYNTVVLFDTSILGPINPAINVGWTAFRDISNIIIIGMFTFIAISIILGVKEYGQKKLVARVLIIAILINFSLLFTQLIVKVSNVAAAQFYQDSAVSPAATEELAAGFNPFGQYATVGIAGRFINSMGISSFMKTNSALTQISEGTQNGWLAFTMGLLMTTLLLAMALVLLYGSFLLVSRAILLIFLMLTSSIAFASHLVPKLSDYGWKKWWESLLSCALLAPILMIFLWITVQVAESLKTTFGGGSLGDIVVNLDKGGNLGALFAYLIILGLLFCSFKFSSMFASGIAGFNYASMAASIPLAAGANMAGFAARFAIGGGAMAASRGLSTAAKAAGNTMRGRMLDRASQGFKYFGKKDFNLANTGVFKDNVTGAAGLKGKWAGQTKGGGVIKREDEHKKAVAEQAERLTYSQKELDQKFVEAQKKAAEAAAGETTLQQNKRNASTGLEEMKADKGEMTKGRETLINDLQGMNATKDILKKELEKIQAEKPTYSGAMDAKNEALAQKQAQIDAQDQRINEATEQLAGYTEAIKAQDDRIADAAGRLGDYTNRLGDIEKGAMRAAMPAGSLNEKGELKARKDILAESAAELMHDRLTNLIPVSIGPGPWGFIGGVNTPQTDRLSKEMRKAVDDREAAKHRKELVEAMEESTKQHREDAGDIKHAVENEGRKDRAAAARNAQQSSHSAGDSAAKGGGDKPH